MKTNMGQMQTYCPVHPKRQRRQITTSAYLHDFIGILLLPPASHRHASPSQVGGVWATLMRQFMAVYICFADLTICDIAYSIQFGEQGRCRSDQWNDDNGMGTGYADCTNDYEIFWAGFRLERWCDGKRAVSSLIHNDRFHTSPRWIYIGKLTTAEG